MATHQGRQNSSLSPLVANHLNPFWDHHMGAVDEDQRLLVEEGIFNAEFLHMSQKLFYFEALFLGDFLFIPVKSQNVLS